MKILISTSSFAKYDNRPFELLENNGFETVINPHGRKLSREELIELAGDCVGVLAGTERYDEDVFQRLPKLRVISRCGVGMDSIDLEAAKRHQVMVMNTPDAPTQAVAELAVGLVLCALRKVNKMDAEVRNGVWKKEMGSLLAGKTLGIIGLGRIGRRVVELLRPFGAAVIAYEPKPDQDWTKKNNVTVMSLDELLEKSDIVTLHVPYTKDTKNLLDAARIARMKEGALLLNTSRGGIVDEKALYDALKTKRLGGAALDVMEKEPYEGPLKELDSIILTPHIGSYAKEARIGMETKAAENLVKALEGKI